MPSRRSLATVLFTDIVGSTERAAELGDRRWHALLDEYVARTRRMLWRYGGHEQNRTGDGLVATFGRPACAIQCAAALRDTTRELGLDQRAGIHMGEVEGKGRSLGGIAVHIAARVIGHARPGEIVVSSTVRDAVEGGEFVFEERGTHALKGVPGEWRLLAAREIPSGGTVPVANRWACRARAQPGRAAAIGGVMVVAAIAAFWLIRGPGAPEAALAAASPGIAVLPFETRGEGLEAWEEGMVDLLTTNLDGVAGLRAIDSRTVLARWREGAADEADGVAAALDVARDVSARYAIVGSATAVGSAVRLAVDVYDAPGKELLGRARVEGSADSLFVLVDRLSIEVLRAILPRRSDAPRFDLARVTTTSLPALEAFLEGEDAYRRADFPSAVAAYERAVESDSTFALAYLRLAATYGWAENVQVCIGGRSVQLSRADEETRLTDLGWLATQRAVRFADRLSERDSQLARAYYALFVADLGGIEPVRLMVRRYPDDVEASYILGELYYHLGSQASIPEEEVERALARATALDPRFAPAYFHRAHVAFGAVDTARMKQLLDAMASNVDPNASWYRQFRLGFPLAFGDAAARSRALSVLDTIQLAEIPPPFNLRAPVLLERRSELHALILRRATEPRQIRAQGRLAVMVLMNRGLVRAALDSIDALDLPPEARAELAYVAHSRGLPVSADRLERDLGSALTDSASAITAFYAGAYAAERGRWNSSVAARARLTAIADHARDVGDPYLARFATSGARALDGFATWKRGRREQALVLLSEAQREATGYAERETANETIRWWLATLLLEMDRPREAAGYLASFRGDPLAAYRLGTLYERLGDRERARAAYATFLEAWKAPDPELATMVEGARRYLAAPVARTTG